MTQKELLYLEDDNLVSFIESEVNSHTELLDNLMELLEGKVNE